MLIATCLLGIVGAIPFTIYRLINGDHLLAFLDASLVIGLSACLYCALKTRKIEIPSTLVGLVSLAVMVGIVHVKGPSNVYTIFPVIMATFCLLTARTAAIMNIIAMFLLLPAFYGVLSSYETVMIYTSMTVLSLFAYFFTLITSQQQFELTRLAARDGLTGAWNRRTLDLSLNQILLSHQIKPLDVSLIILDIDHFKSINDKHGHGVGDEILQKVAKLLSSIGGISDKVYRYGGEEFVVVSEGRHIKAAEVLAETIRSRVENSQFLKNQKVTISLGIAELKQADTEEEWLSQADEALYRAKNQGRNQYCLAKDSNTPENLTLAI
jgi:diguanylate cyclase (GGDEF)-like protein